MSRSALFRNGLVAVILLSGLLMASLAQAQDQVGVKMQPTKIEERVDPGQAVTGMITVSNQSAITQTFYLAARDVINVDLEGRGQFEDSTDTSGARLSSWVILGQPSVTLEPGEADDVVYRIEVPEDASPGGHFAAIFFDRRPDEVSSSGAGVGFQVGTLLNIQVNGEMIEDVIIREFSTDQAIYTALPVEFTTIVRNEGNVFQEPRGLLEIKDMLGNEVITLNVNESEGDALPGTERRYFTDWIDEDGFYLGRYDARVSLIYGQGNKSTIVRETSFWVIPAKPLLYIFGALLVFLIIFYGFIKLYVRSQLKKAGLRSEKKAQYNQQTFLQRFSKVLIVILVILLLLLMALFMFYA